MLELALRTSAILLTAGAMCVVLRRAAAATRHLVLHGAVVAVLLAPLLLAVTPTFDLPVGALGFDLVRFAPAAADAVRQSQPVQAASSLNDAIALGSGAPPVQTIGLTWTRLVLATWVTGAVLCAVWFVLGWIRAGRMARRALPADPRWQLELNDLCARLQIRREVRLRCISAHTSPLVTGLFDPCVLLPVHAHEWDVERRRSVLLHELAHVQRGDCRVQALAQAACALYWFNPLIWLTFARLRAERERACDDRVLMSGLRPSVYARHLLDITRDLRRGLRPSAALAMARPSEVERRLMAVLAPTHARRPTGWTRALVLVIVAVLTGGSLSASPSARPMPLPDSGRVASAPRFRVPLDSSPPDARSTTLAATAQASRALQSSSDSETRERAVLDLIAADQDAAIEPLRSALDDPSQDIREKAALGLALRSGPDVIPALVKALGDRDSQVREKAALGLAMRRDDRATEALLATADDPDPQVREKVAMALGTSGDARATAVLNRMVADRDPQVREKAAAALVLFGRGAGTSVEAETIRGGLRSLVATLARITQ
jgi:beta-lactamase regulating signal transducer with metallopeptidase domain